MQGVRFRALVGEEEELSHSPAEVDRDAHLHRCGLGKVQLMEGAIRKGREGWRCKRDGNGFQELSPGLFSGARRAQVRGGSALAAACWSGQDRLGNFDGRVCSDAAKGIAAAARRGDKGYLLKEDQLQRYKIMDYLHRDE